jgi:hypothetical protein
MVRRIRRAWRRDRVFARRREEEGTMSRTNEKNRSLQATVLAAAVLAGGCALMEPKAERYQPPPVGSTWTIAQRNTGSYGQDAQFTVTRGEATWQGQRVIALASSRGFTTMVHPETGRWIAIVGRDGTPLFSWDPPLGWEWPLEVGKTWTTSYRMTMHAAKRTVPYDFSCKVEDYGDVTVRAGTFKAFRIACKSTIGTDEMYWSSPELGVFLKSSIKRDASSPNGVGTQETELVSQTIRQ